MRPLHSSERSKKAWEAAPLPSQILDADGSILAINAAWEDLTGYRASEAIGRSYEHFVPKSSLEAFWENMRVLKETGRLEGADCFIQRKDGSSRNVLVFAQLEQGEPPLIRCSLVDSTSQNEAKHAIAESEKRFRSLFELSPTPIVIHDGRSIVLANEATARFLGFDSAEDIIGHSLADLVHPESGPQIAQRVKRMMADDWTAPLAIEGYLRTDGTTVFAETVASPIKVEGQRLIQVVAIDISQRRLTETALEESEERFENLFQASADPIVVHDGERVIMANAAAFEAFGMPSDRDVEGFEIVDLIHPDSIGEVRFRLADLDSDTESERNDIRLFRTDGATWDADVMTSHVTLNGKHVFHSTFRDVTEKRRVEEELDRYRTQLEQLIDAKTRNLDRVKEELAAVAAVVGSAIEIRDPYTAGHQRRVAELSVEIATRMALDEDDVRMIEIAAGMHDVGKISVPGEILSKPTQLSPIEYELVMTHAQAGYDVLLSAKVHRPIADIVWQHHERLDGSGYPRGIEGDDVLLGARVIAVADVFEAMASHRPYRPALGIDAALEELDLGKGTLYDSEAVDICTTLVQEGFTFSNPER